MQTALTASNRAYSFILLFYPHELRERFGDEMSDVFQQQLEEAWDESGIAGLLRVWLCVVRELLCVALPTQMGQPIIVVPTLSLLSNSVLFLALLRELSPLAELCRAYRH